MICGEDKIVTVHHWDFNHGNNEPSNLIPICPTHHQYLHSRYKVLIEEQVNVYREMFLENHSQELFENEYADEEYEPVEEEY